MKMNVLLESLNSYYNSNPKNMEYLLNIIETNHKVSLRIIDWFVTNYSKKFNVFYTIYKISPNEYTLKEEGNQVLKQFNTYHSYKSQLKSFSKKKFDPFCRRQRIDFECQGKTIQTTIGQLNFFKWAIENLIIEYIMLHYDEIEEDMNQSYMLIKKHKKNSNERKKRQELSKSASRGLNNKNIRVILDFD